MYFDDFEYGDVLSSVFLPFVSEVRCLVRMSGHPKAKRRLAEKALAYLDLLVPAFEKQGGIQVRHRGAICKFRSQYSCHHSETELDEVLNEASQQIEAIVLLMDVGPPTADI